MSWLTIEQAAKRVGRGESTIRRWFGQGLPSVAGRVAEDKLLDFERTKRENRGRPRKVDPVARVLADVVAETTRQDAKWGEQNHPDGTGPELVPLPAGLEGLSAHSLSLWAREVTDMNAAEGSVTWRDILLEEVFEAIAEEDPARLRVELVQVAAVATQWVEAIDRRSTNQTDGSER